MKKSLYMFLCFLIFMLNFQDVHASSTELIKHPALDGTWDSTGYNPDLEDNWVGYSGSYGKQRTYIQYDLSDISEGFTEAKLHLQVTEYQDLNPTDGAVPFIKVVGSSKNLKSGGFYEPNPGDPVLNPTDMSIMKGQEKVIDVTAFVQNRMELDKIVTFTLIGDEVVPNVQASIGGKTSPDVSKRPKLVIKTGVVTEITAVTNPTAIAGLTNGTAKSATALGLPSQVEVTLSDNTKKIVDVIWDVASTTYDPMKKTSQTFTVIGTLSNLPANVKNKNNKTASISVTVDAEVPKTKDIISVATLPAKTGLVNGTEKTEAALALPMEVDVTLDDNSTTNVDIIWDIASATYDPAKKTKQTFTVEGILTPLPANVTNTTDKKASISVTVDAEVPKTKDIISVATLPAKTGLVNGTDKTVAALGLPVEVDVTLDDNSTSNVDINWDLASTTYDPTKKTKQTFTVEGTLTPLPANVTNTTDKKASISVTVDAEVPKTKDIISVATLPAKTGLANGTEKTEAALALPMEVDVTLDDNSTTNVDIIWDLASAAYDPAKKTKQTFTVEGTLTPLPANVTNTTDKKASISVTVDAEVPKTKDIISVATLPAKTGLANGT
ncbi:Ig-like domain-containing protein, partial [Brevibacillus sp. NPDC003359]|uniref:Ig-like domain-containing protein n=1 Tax=unclassified Brevibacillus TaxID=2684853 RepID=UPI0036D13644